MSEKITYYNGESPMKPKHETSQSLFAAIMKMARESGHFKEIDEILDYDSASWYDHENRRPITSEEFDTVFSVDYGGSEGIYIDARITGFPFGRESGEFSFHFGTLKTLNRDLQSMMLMGKACGILQHFSHEYVNANIDRFSPTEEKKKEA